MRRLRPVSRALAALAAICLAALCAAGCSNGTAPEPSSFGQARQAYLAGDLTRAAALYQDYLKAGPGGQTRAARKEAFWRLALIAGVAGGKGKAAEVLEAAAIDFADDAEYLAFFLPELARAQEADRQYAKAAETLVRLAELDTISPQERAGTLVKLARDQRRLKKMPQAKQTLAKCLEIAGESGREAACRSESALIAAMENNWTAAAKELETVAALERNQNPETLLGLAEAYENTDRKSDAAKIYRDLATTYPNLAAIAARLSQPGK